MAGRTASSPTRAWALGPPSRHRERIGAERSGAAAGRTHRMHRPHLCRWDVPVARCRWVAVRWRVSVHRPGGSASDCIPRSERSGRGGSWFARGSPLLRHGYVRRRGPGAARGASEQCQWRSFSPAIVGSIMGAGGSESPPPSSARTTSPHTWESDGTRIAEPGPPLDDYGRR